QSPSAARGWCRTRARSRCADGRRTGLTTAPSRALYREDFTPGHDRGMVLADAAVMMADSGNTVRGIDVLRRQHDLLGDVASPAALSRAPDEVDQAAL